MVTPNTIPLIVGREVEISHPPEIINLNLILLLLSLLLPLVPPINIFPSLSFRYRNHLFIQRKASGLFRGCIYINLHFYCGSNSQNQGQLLNHPN